MNNFSVYYFWLLFIICCFINVLSFLKEIFKEGGSLCMTTADLIWKLVELLLKNDDKANDSNAKK